MSKFEKEIQKKMLIKKTISEMEKQIQKLEASKNAYVEAGRKAKEKGLTAQYNLALSGLKMAIVQQRRVMEMKLNFEITSQMKDMTQMTETFLNGMSVLSKDMLKMSKNSKFEKVQNQFNDAMMTMQENTEKMEAFMDATQETIASGATMPEESSKELEAMIGNSGSGAAGASSGDIESQIDKELEALKKKMGN